MRATLASIRTQLDRTGIFLSGLCVVHCVAGIFLVTVLGLGGGALLEPRIHEIGLAVAIAIAAVTLGIGVLRHGAFAPLATGACGIALMAGGLAVQHGLGEALLTVTGVTLVAFAHIRNLRRAC
jgi:hypothetical protein